MGAQVISSKIPPKTSPSPFNNFSNISLFRSSNPNFLRINQFVPSAPIRLTFNPIACKTQVIRAVDSKKDVVDVNYSDSNPRRKKLGVFVSGGGSNFKAIYEATCNGTVFGDVVVLVTNKTGCGGAAYAKENDIPVLQYPKAKGESEGLSTDGLISALRNYEVDYILLAGYLKLIPVELVRNYPKRILNIHPSLLPAFGGKGYYGLKVHKAVITSGARYSGPTIHFVDEEYDTGRILAQEVVPVCAFDTPEDLAARVLHEEHRLYTNVVEALCEDRVIWRDDGVPLIQSKEDPEEYS